MEYPEESGHKGIAACSYALVKIVNSSVDRCVKACCHKPRMGLSVGTLAATCSKLLEDVGVGCISELK